MLVKDPKAMREIMSRLNENTIDASKKISRVKGTLYGDSGAGKTVILTLLAKKLIKPGQIVLFIDRSEGWVSLRNHKDANLPDDVKIVEFESIEQLSVIADAIYRKVGYFGDVGAVVLDDADLMASDQLNNIWAKRVMENTSTLDKDKPERPDYLKLLMQFMEVITDIYKKTPDVHLLMTAHTGKTKNKEGAVLGVFPGFSPALADQIKAEQTFVGRLTAKAVSKDDTRYERFVQTYPTSMVDAKTRIRFPKVNNPVGSFISDIVEWSSTGLPEITEKEAVKLEITGKTIVTEADLEIMSADDDD